MGLLLGTIFLLKAATLALAVYAMGLDTWRVGGPITLLELGVWTLIIAGAVWFGAEGSIAFQALTEAAHAAEGSAIHI